MGAPSHTERLHALDAVRAVMMLLGLVLHAAVSYVQIPLGGAWGYKDASTNVVFDHLVFGIHVFRMPVFFVMAGFFACMLHERRGASGMLRNRAMRILLPFVVGWIVLVPLVVSGFEFADDVQQAGFHAGIVAAGTVLDSNPYTDSTVHLWFLYDLLYFYVAAVVLARAVTALPATWRKAALDGFAALTRSRWRVFPLAGLTMLTLMPMRRGALDTSTSFVPDAKVLTAYAVFFFFGWLLWHRRAEVASFARRAWLATLAGFALMPVNMVAIQRLVDAGPEGNRAAFLLIAATGALSVWFLVFGITGLFLRYLDRPMPTVRYIVDASYWLYLIHLPFTIWVPGLLAPLDWPAAVKVLAVLALSTPVWLLSYHYLVRATPIGFVLNGRRFPRVSPLGAQAHRIVAPPAPTAGASTTA